MVDSSRFFEQKMKQLFLETLIPDFWKININIPCIEIQILYCM